VALTAGARLGPYEITAQIGVGGMGEVYRATDTNLARQVAIKVLLEAVASDTERLARFDREACSGRVGTGRNRTSLRKPPTEPAQSNA
jgi:serine/threonine protein kinase